MNHPNTENFSSNMSKHNKKSIIFTTSGIHKKLSADLFIIIFLIIFVQYQSSEQLFVIKVNARASIAATKNKDSYWMNFPISLYPTVQSENVFTHYI